MLEFPAINPVLLSIGPIHVRWYGLMYVFGFLAAWLLSSYQAKRFKWPVFSQHFDNLSLALMLGLVLGGRFGYVFLYHLDYYMSHPSQIPAIWSGGMSFHGACLGTILAGALYCWRRKLDFWRAVDIVIVTVPVGLFFGRIGNFINGELYGRVSDVPWAMIFPRGGFIPRHPSQLYEAALEGLLLFVILWSIKALPWRNPQSKYWPHGSMLAIFLSGYAVFRFIVEFFREPDVQLGLLFLQFSMGQWLCLLMFGIGVGLWGWRVVRQG